MPFLFERAGEAADRLVTVRFVAPATARVLAVVLRFAAVALFGLDARRALARRFVACAELPATPCARLRCAPSAAARVNVRPHSGQTKSSPAGGLDAERDRLEVARFFAADCLFAVAIGSFLSRWMTM
jgi:hypothetical protein